MSLRDEIEGNRAKIAQAQERDRLSNQLSRPTFKTYPEGFYNAGQYSHWIKDDYIIKQCSRQFFDEAELPSFFLEREFRPDTRELAYVLSNEGGHLSEEWNSRMYYEPGGFMSARGLMVRCGLPVLVPRNQREAGNLQPNNLIAYLSSDSELYVSHPYIQALDVNEQNVRDLLTLMTSNPDLPITLRV